MTLIKPNQYVGDLIPYVPGKPVEELERELGIRGAVKIASNENPLGPSPKVLRAGMGAHFALRVATGADLEALHARLRRVLLASGFLDPAEPGRGHTQKDDAAAEGAGGASCQEIGRADEGNSRRTMTEIGNEDGLFVIKDAFIVTCRHAVLLQLGQH